MEDYTDYPETEATATEYSKEEESSEEEESEDEGGVDSVDALLDEVMDSTVVTETHTDDAPMPQPRYKV